MRQTSWTEADLQRAKVAFENTGWSWRRISAETGIPAGTLSGRAKRGGWQRCERAGVQPAVLAKATRRRRTTAAARRRQVLDRLWALLERHLAEAEARASTKAGLAAGDREMRTLAGILKNIRDCEWLESSRSAKATTTPKESPRDDGASATRSPDEIRQAFSDLVAELFEGRSLPPDCDLAAGGAAVAAPRPLAPDSP